jgi:hypothetical protein
MLKLVRWRLVIAFALSAPVWSQAPATGLSFPVPAFSRAPEPPIPEDPLELVAGNAEPVQDASRRAALASLLAKARALSNVRAYPYDLKTTFTALGTQNSDGNWQLENASIRKVYRWTAQGPGYSIINVNKDGLLYSSQPGAPIPLRLAQARAAIFYVEALIGPHASVRATQASVNGMVVTCVLIGRMSAPIAVTGNRVWNESEFCVEPTSGLLMTYSPVPGLYVEYDYSTTIHFHDRIIPTKFTITEAGRVVLEARTESVNDPTNLDSSLSDTSRLAVSGAGRLEDPPSSMRLISSGAPVAGAFTRRFVIVNGMMSSDGRITEPEVIATSDPSLSQQALDFVASFGSGANRITAQPGVTPRSHEVYCTVEFITPAP